MVAYQPPSTNTVLAHWIFGWLTSGPVAMENSGRELYTHSDGRVEWLLRNSWPHHWNVELWSAVGLFIIGATVVTLLQRWRSLGRKASSMNGNEKTWLGVIGHPIAHSMSPQLFQDIFHKHNRSDLEYHAFDIENVEQLQSLLNAQNQIRGLNVTHPLKQAVMPFVDHPTFNRGTSCWSGQHPRSYACWMGRAQHRCLGIQTGYPTLFGQPARTRPGSRNRGSAAAVHFVLKELGIETVAVSRNGSSNNDETFKQRPCIGYHELTEMTLRHHLLVVNCTPVGMHPNTSHCPQLPMSFLTPDHLVVDLIYNPTETQLLSKARNKGCDTLNGLDMLQLQAQNLGKFGWPRGCSDWGKQLILMEMSKALPPTEQPGPVDDLHLLSMDELMLSMHHVDA